MKSIDRILDFLGLGAMGVVTVAAAGVAMPAWLVIAAAVVSFASGKASSPGMPFLPKKPKETP